MGFLYIVEFLNFRSGFMVIDCLGYFVLEAVYVNKFRKLMKGIRFCWYLIKILGLFFFTCFIFDLI